jgi:hypothetical protein
MKKKTQDLNMSRVWRDELKTLRRNRRKLDSDHNAFSRDLKKKFLALERELNRGGRAHHKMKASIDRRIAILEGRLS